VTRRGPIEKVLVLRRDEGGWQRTPDEVVVEEPLEIRLDGHLAATTMRTPGHDFELAAGFCHGDGLLAGATVQSIRYCGTGSATETEFNVVSVETGGAAPVPAPRLGNIGSSCGLCGSTAIDDLRERLRPLPSPVRFPGDVLVGVPERVRADQELFERTGGLHAAAAFQGDGTPVVLREDIGRHNAVDKVVGHLLLDGGLPAEGLGLFVSGRASFEIVQKAWAAGFGTVVAVSAPSALAIEAATRAGMTLVGFARGEVLNVYAGDVADGRA
jgi:FdhD protein